MSPHRLQHPAPDAGQCRQQTPTLGGQLNVMFGAVGALGKQMSTQHLQDGVHVGCHVYFLHWRRGQQRRMVEALQREQERRRGGEEETTEQRRISIKKTTNNNDCGHDLLTPHLFASRPPSCAANTSRTWWCWPWTWNAYAEREGLLPCLNINIEKQ